MPSILFICTANICRSPMASAIMQIICSERSDPKLWRVESAGTWANDGDSVAEGTEIVMDSRGIDVSTHRSRVVRREIIDEFDLVLTMERGHKEALQIEFPDISDRIFMLSEMIGLTFDIGDPYGGPLIGYEKTASDIERILDEGFDNIQTLASRIEY